MQPTGLGLLQIYETPSRRHFGWFAAIKIKRRSNAKEGANKHSLFISVPSAFHEVIGAAGLVQLIVRLRGGVQLKGGVQAN